MIRKILVIACAAVVSLHLEAPASASVEGERDYKPGTSQLPPNSELDRIYSDYMFLTDTGFVQFDLKRAEEAGEKPVVLRLGDDINQMALISGPGFPVNEADQICQNHDFCLAEASGDPNKEVDCDRRFVKSMRAVRERFSGEDRWYIEKAIALISATPLCRRFGC